MLLQPIRCTARSGPIQPLTRQHWLLQQLALAQYTAPSTQPRCSSHYRAAAHPTVCLQPLTPQATSQPHMLPRSSHSAAPMSATRTAPLPQPHLHHNTTRLPRSTLRQTSPPAASHPTWHAAATHTFPPHTTCSHSAPACLVPPHTGTLPSPTLFSSSAGLGMSPSKEGSCSSALPALKSLAATSCCSCASDPLFLTALSEATT
jgi:hypothetical protein